MDQAHTDLLERYADAFQRYDMTALVALLHEDVVMSMPPYDLWLRGTESFTAWMTGTGCQCEGSRLVPISANGRPGFGQYRRHPEGGLPRLGGAGAGDQRRAGSPG
jgi:RNA polymerase sigma-70 factor (ECF subfamily)